MQPRILHLLGHLGLDPRVTPASNVVFVRSSDEGSLKTEKSSLLDACWPIHEAVIDTLGIRVVACLGKTAGNWVRRKTGAWRLVDHFIETNDRRWSSCAHEADDGKIVVTLTHPSRVDWRNPLADPSAMVARVIGR